MQVKILFITLLSFMTALFMGCKNDTSNKVIDAKAFFYPSSNAPYVYIFQDSLDPFYEMFERIITYHDPSGEHRVIQRYNANFDLVEAYDILVDKNYKVLTHTLYSGNREIPAQVHDSVFMPWTGSGIFSSSFPGAVDSIMFTLRNKRHLTDEQGSFELSENQYETRIFVDSIYTLAIDLKNKKEKAQSAVAYHEFAKDLGRVRIRTADGASILVLVKILSDEDWKRLITKM